MKRMMILALCIVMLLSFVACGNQGAASETKNQETNVESATTNSQPTDVRVYMIAGPTGIGAAPLMKQAENNQVVDGNRYRFEVVASPNEIVAKISNGEADIAAVATNLASKLYKVTDGGVKVLAVNTLGVLNVLTLGGDPVNSIADLRGRKIVTTGQGANPEFIINELLSKNGLNPQSDVQIEFKAEGSELVPVWAQNQDAVIVAPHPVATSILKKYSGSKSALDLTEEWNKVNPDSALMMGCVIVRAAFLEAHPEAVKSFMNAYKASIQAVNDDPQTAGSLCESFGIVPSAAIATAAIPSCHICYVDGAEMRIKLTGYLQVLLGANAASIGGQIPGDGFWYVEQGG